MARVKRQIIRIDEEKCNGCGKCVSACVEGAIQIVDGKARLVSESYCDGLGACIGECPQGAITIEEREAEEFDEAAVLAHKREASHKHEKAGKSVHAGLQAEYSGHHAYSDGSVCPSAQTIDRRRIRRSNVSKEAPTAGYVRSELVNWPVKLYLVNPGASFLQDADLLIASDCTAFAYGSFHPELLRDRVLLIGCPKLDEIDLHSRKLTEILQRNNIRSITVAKMEVPCCFGLARLAEAAVRASGKQVPIDIVTVSVDGEIINRQCCAADLG
ncbi:MAG: ATP-binding protein [Armatimonadota bacterium]